MKLSSSSKHSATLKAFEGSCKSGENSKISSSIFSKSNNVSRVRFCRVFYGSERYSRIYNKDASMACSLLRYVDKSIGELTLIEVIRAIDPSAKLSNEVLIISRELVVLLDCNTCQIQWKIPPQSIKNIGEKETQLDIHLTVALKTKTEALDKLSLQTSNPKIAALIAKKLECARTYLLN